MAPLVRSYVMRASAAGTAAAMVGMILPKSFGHEVAAPFFACLAMTLLSIFGAVWLEMPPAQRERSSRRRSARAARPATAAHSVGGAQ